MSPFEAFLAQARDVVEAEAAAHADDRWWVLEPVLLVQRRDGRAERRALGPDALRAGGLPGLPDALRVRRAAIALHVDLLAGGERFPAIVLGVAGRMAASVTYAAVERTDLGTPRLGPWHPGPDLAGELAAAMARALTRPVGSPRP